MKKNSLKYRNYMSLKMKEVMNNPETSKKLSKTVKSLWLDPIYRQMQVDSHRGKVSGMKGHKLTDEQKDNHRVRMLGLSSPMRDRKHSIETKKKMSLARLGKPRNYDVVFTSEVRSRISNKLKELWKGQEYRDHQMKNSIVAMHTVSSIQKSLPKILQSRKNRPNNLERRLIDLLKKFSLPFDYVGDGKVIIVDKCPDFINKDKRLLIELCGSYWHTEEEIDRKVKFYKKYNFDTLVIWDYELENQERLVKKIKDFLGEKRND